MVWVCNLQVGAFSVLKELVIVLPDSLSDHMGSLVPGIEKALNVSIEDQNLFELPPDVNNSSYY